MIEPQDSVLLGVSGGADSVFMSLLFKEIEEIFKLKIGVAYINHKQRDVRKEINFVKNLSKNYNWQFFLKNIKMDEEGSPEELLRVQRLSCLKEIAKKNGYKKIGLAHTKDDQAETILMRFLKGTSLRGLSGIKPINEGIFIHPLLCFKKEEILEYLKKEKIPYLLDPTNFNLSFLRNKLRHLVFPFL
ncbi:MAG: tRNA lysidine(34) synthetase TilS, partial [Thermoanaerobaculia bacterium]